MAGHPRTRGEWVMQHAALAAYYVMTACIWLNFYYKTNRGVVLGGLLLFLVCGYFAIKLLNDTT
jgi:hypothetical protein